MRRTNPKHWFNWLDDFIVIVFVQWVACVLLFSLFSFYSLSHSLFVDWTWLVLISFVFRWCAHIWDCILHLAMVMCSKASIVISILYNLLVLSDKVYKDDNELLNKKNRREKYLMVCKTKCRKCLTLAWLKHVIH